MENEKPRNNRRQPLPIDAPRFQYTSHMKSSAAPTFDDPNRDNKISSKKHIDLLQDCSDDCESMDNDFGLDFAQPSTQQPQNNFSNLTSFNNLNSRKNNDMMRQSKPTFPECNQIQQQTNSNDSKKPKVSYEDIAKQAQNLLNKLNVSNPPPPTDSNINNNIPNSNNGIESTAMKSTPSKSLQPLLQISQLQRNLSDNQFNENFNDNVTTSTKIINSARQPQATFPSPSTAATQNTSQNAYPSSARQSYNSKNLINFDDLDPNAKRLDTASEMVYPSGRHEILPHSYLEGLKKEKDQKK